MSWLGTVGIAVLTAAFGALLSGIVASLAVDWYRISSFEGGSGYFVIFIALGGLLGSRNRTRPPDSDRHDHAGEQHEASNRQRA